MTPEPEIDSRKFTEYSLNPNHPDNKGKWQAFAQLGYDVETLEERNQAAKNLIQQLRQGLINVPSIPGEPTVHGLIFKVRIRITGLNSQEGTLVTSWQIDVGKDIPRLITNWLEIDR
ncbi:hypothetical protein QUA82_04325 [Microcoleus sp. F8-D3]